mgnify:CR=1 FL=1
MSARKWRFEAHWHTPKGFLVGAIVQYREAVSIHLGPFYLSWWKDWEL